MGLGDLLTFTNYPLFLGTLTFATTFITLIAQEIINSNININIGFNQQFFHNTQQINVLKDIKFTNEQLTRMMYLNYAEKLNVPFSYKQYERETRKGLNNIEKVKIAIISIYEEKIWVKNNFRNYNLNLINWYNEFFYFKAKFLYCDYIINNMLFEKNIWLFNNETKIDMKTIFNRNYLPYKLHPLYLKTIILNKNCDFLI